ncbi:decaprenyl-phosphate phosphoribosyltransferase [Desertivibrio insolitus]|uniref:decaprenyl-phosphate phosphoribosyltransferase n=1 Tax=Herbiconiux sp. SYSU D00978 TaxID=2812562 RepID=UPI001A957236|nr:decaprenyl-phosphate phosphoribosyltransferase [Herbiconiux sp. SYSU D00978]
MTRGIIKTARIRQWVKNVLVFAAPLAAGQVFQADVILATLVAFGAFSLSASAIYFLNDALDVEADRDHPRKRHRPIAAGVVPIPIALTVSVLLLAGGVALASVANVQLVAVILVYDVVQILYCLWLKHQPILDIAVVSSGFLLRGIAGGVAAEVALSQWFLLVAVFGSLLMVAGKRFAEIKANPDLEGEVRRSLRGYTDSYLGFVWHSAATILVLGYSLWAFELQTSVRNPWIAISVAPFILAVLRYVQHIDRGDAEAPEDIALSDRLLQVLALLWLAVLGVGLYLVPALG